MISPTRRLLRFFAVALVLLTVATILVVRSRPFQNYVREHLISYIERSTGGQTQMRSFQFDWRTLTATITGLTIHGTESSTEPPLFYAPRIVLRFSLFSFGQTVNIAYLAIDRPLVNILVFPNHQTNIPTPQKSSAGLSRDLSVTIDLAVRQFDISDGSVRLADGNIPLTLHGSDFLVAFLYDRPRSEYRGQISTFLTAQYRSAITSRLVLPVSIGHSAISITNARLTTAKSSLNASARLFHLSSPQVLVDLNARVNLAELQSVTGAPLHLSPGAPQFVDLQSTLTATPVGIVLQRASLNLGKSQITAAAAENTEASFHGSISLDELSRLFVLPELPSGTVSLSGQADFLFANYSVKGSFAGHNLNFKYDDLRKVDLSGVFAASPASIELSQLDLHAMGATLSAIASIRDFRTVTATANLRGFSVSQAIELGLRRNLGYSGFISCSLQANGPLVAPAISANLSIAPGRTGIPLSGRLQAGYNGTTRVITILHSQFMLPHSQLELRGQPGREAQLTIRSRNLSDFSPLSATLVRSPVAFSAGLASLTLTARGPLVQPLLSGSVNVTQFVIHGRRFDTLSALVTASPADLDIKNGTLDCGTSNVHFSLSLGLNHWKLRPTEPLAAELAIQNGRLSDFLTLAGEQAIPAEGQVSAAIHLAGTFDNPQGAVELRVANGQFSNDVFSNASLSAELSDRLIVVKKLQINAPAGELNLQASFAHPPTDLTVGTVRAQVSTSSIELSRVAALQSYRPGFAGTLQLDVSFEGTTSHRIWSATSVNGHVNAANLRDHAEHYGDLRLATTTQAGAATVTVASTLADSATQLNGAVRLSNDYPFSADLKITHLSLGKLVSFVDLTNLPAAGNFDCTAHLSGTRAEIAASTGLQLTKARLFNQPIERLSADIAYRPELIKVASAHAVTPAGSIDFSASFSHPASDLREGHLEGHVSTRDLNLSRIDEIRKVSPGLNGVLALNASGIAELTRSTGVEQILPLSVDADARLRQLSVTGESLGNLTFQAHTNSKVASFNLTSTVAHASLIGNGTVDLQPGYRAKLDVSFNNLTYAGLEPFVGHAPNQTLNAVADGSARFEGSLTAPRASTGQLQLTRLEASPVENVTFKNQGTLTLTLNDSRLSIANARIVGPSTDFAIAGSIGLTSKATMDLAIRANSDLAGLKSFFPGAVASGIVDVNGSLRGTLAAPALGGQVRLTHGSFQRVSWPNGIYDADAVILLSGSGGQIQSFTAQSGGGKINLAGFFSLAESTLTYNFHAAARQVRTRYSGVSVTANALLTLSGTTRRGLLTGGITISRVGYGQQTDIGSILSSVTKPPATPSATVGPLSEIRANVQIRTAPNVLFQTTLAQQLAATADLTLLGSLQNPGMVGRINITSGSLIFFANKYSVNRGLISFYDATTIQPVLDIDLETTAQGVDVNLGVAGPIDNLKLTYRSDPPLKFEDIIALLAAGRTPPDANIAATQPVAPDQSAMQMGESALVGAAIANPVASELQRVFGITQLTIAPTFVSGTAVPQAQVTLQQQVTQEVTLTYSQDLSQSNAELVRIEWDLTPRFSAVATRDQNGIFSIDILWKKQFR